jgi:hypothetical protein
VNDGSVAIFRVARNKKSTSDSVSWSGEVNNGSGLHICVLRENHPLPFDRRVWQETRARR